MNDLIRLRELFDKLGVKHTLDDSPYAHPRLDYTGPMTVLTINEGIGYAGFFTVFYFDDHGKYLGHGVWE